MDPRGKTAFVGSRERDVVYISIPTATLVVDTFSILGGD